MKKAINKGINLFLFVLLLSIIATIFQNYYVNKTFILVLVSISTLSFYSILSLKDLGIILKKKDSSQALRRVASMQFFRKLPQMATPLLEAGDSALWGLIKSVEFHKSIKYKNLSIGDSANEFLDLELSDPSIAFIII